LQYQLPAPGVSPSLFQKKALSITGSNFVNASITVPVTGSGIAIPVSNLANLGMSEFLNQDPVNFVVLLSAVAGSPLLTMLAGDPAQFRFNSHITAPALLAYGSSPVNVAYFILEN
jgi:hypothetical protein